jgi:predicted N-acetyltransferase YhbS
MNVSTNSTTITIRLERAADDAAIESLGARAFGPGRFSRAAFRLREGVPQDNSLSYVADLNGTVTGSIRLTPILIGGKDALVLGPLMIEPAYRNMGIGRELMNRSLHEAWTGGHRYVVLVGDYAYYKAFGFRRIEPGRITFPGPADPARILGLELVEGAAGDYAGPATRRFKPRS